MLSFLTSLVIFQGSEIQFTSATQCTFPRSSALALGLTLAVALLMAQVILNVATGCICCKRNPNPSNSNWTIASACFVVSWFAFVIAFLLLLTGAALNDQHGEVSFYFGIYYCYVVKPEVFACSTVSALASVILGILYYLAFNSSNSVYGPWGNPPVSNPSSVAMG
ncbi:uncharacterized protein LOC110653592 [Hevea brasiliensis]|uniref:uncharacterized protein LOC110653592 n=1 Tax=Hevea brasiliensis TaxID=3981 RepID=UPI0025F61AEE|nr:uncharacterized protein LOC110653592 [Hevea brasiliensis]